MKFFAKISIYALFIVGILMSFLPISWFPSFYYVRYSGYAMVVASLIIYLLPKLMRVPPNSTGAEKKNKAADLFQFIIALAIVADALGSLGLYELYRFGIPYSFILHIAIPFLSVILLSRVINWRFECNILYSIIISFILVMLCSIGWEIFENTCDYFLNTNFTGPSQSIETNTTVLNLIQDTIGSLLGAFIVLLKAKSNR